MARHCSDFTRSSLLRRAAAEAGRGLPTVEPGQPLPAGTGLDRRTFLIGSGALALSVYGGSRLGLEALDAGVAEARAAGADQRVLVSVCLEGGLDSLSVLAPVSDSRYRRLRPSLAVGRAGSLPFAEDDRLRWHPIARPLAELHREGKVTVLPGIGYTDPDQSHFTSRHFYEVGARDAHLRTGWLGRFIDVAGTPDNPLQGVTAGRRLSPVLATAENPVAASDSLTPRLSASLGLGPQGVPHRTDYMVKLGEAHLGSREPALRQAAVTAIRARAVSDALVHYRFDEGNASEVRYPNPRANRGRLLGGGQGGGGEDFPERLRALAELLGGGAPVRVAALAGPGDHDTHAQQAPSFQYDVKLTADSLYAFQRDLEQRGLADRVLTLVWSEFGRRAAENGSRGTDHGAAGIGFVIGTAVRGKMIGEFPGLARLDPLGNLRATSDFRALYCSILEQWFETDAAPVIPGASRFQRYRILG